MNRGMLSLVFFALVAGAPLAFGAPLSVLNEAVRVTVPESVHPRVANLMPTARVSADLPMEQMLLVLKMDAQSRASLEQLLKDQQDPASPSYHQWLTPEAFGTRFGPSAQQVGKASVWLMGHGLKINGVAKSGLAISFSGTAAQVEETFQTSIMEYQVDGVTHHANATSVSIPKELAGYVGGVASLNDFKRTPFYTLKGRVSDAQLQGAASGQSRTLARDSSGDNLIGPVDFATIYDLLPVFRSYTGAAFRIGVAERTDIQPSDFTQFQGLQLPPTGSGYTYSGGLNIIHNGVDPGILDDNEVFEADIDTQWASASAPGATVDMVVSSSSYTTDGVDLSCQYLVDKNLDAVVSVSFGSCEAAMGSANALFFDQLWAQAAGQGISVFVSSGDDGAAGCGTSKGVNGLASSPYDTAVGGTMFQEGSGHYWGTTAIDSGTFPATAGGYIPEGVWNESGVGASGGGSSLWYAKPSWQNPAGVTGMPADGKRDIPDVALDAAAEHDAYLVCLGGNVYGAGGTSVAAPNMAGIMALVVQKYGRQGSANPTLYSLQSSNAVFHDIATGTNNFDGVAGYSAGHGYDLCTGLGSVDANQLVTSWVASSNPITVSILTPASSPTVASGASVSFTGSASGSGSLTYTWAFGDGSTATVADPGVPVSHTYFNNSTRSPETLFASLTASDGSYSNSYTVSVTVNPSPVTAVIASPVTSSGVLPGVPVAFQGIAVSSASPTISYSWTFGDGGTATGASVTHTFQENASAPYMVTLTATDGAANSTSASLQMVADTASVMDTNAEGVVDVRALLAMAGAWGVSATPAELVSGAIDPAVLNGLVVPCDLNADGTVNDTDLNLWLAHFVPVAE